MPIPVNTLMNERDALIDEYRAISKAAVLSLKRCREINTRLVEIEKEIEERVGFLALTDDEVTFLSDRIIDFDPASLEASFKSGLDAVPPNMTIEEFKAWVVNPSAIKNPHVVISLDMDDPSALEYLEVTGIPIPDEVRALLTPKPKATNMRLVHDQTVDAPSQKH